MGVLGIRVLIAGMIVVFILLGILIVIMALRVPADNARATLPTAIPGVSMKAGEYATPSTKSKTPARGMTSTPAPFATKLPPTPLPPPKGVPHDLRGKDDCMYCHKGNTYFAVPASHARRTNQMCLGCHALSLSAPRPTPRTAPHAVANRAECLGCHLRGDNGARAVPGDHAGRTNDTCLGCHRSK